MPFSAATWNVNSIRVRSPVVCDWLNEHRPDLLALQELKVPTEEFPADLFQEHGYTTAVFGQKTYNGVALLSRAPLEELSRGIPGMENDPQARAIAGRYGSLSIINVYVPNGQDIGTDKYAYKLAWLEAFATYLEARFDPQKPLLVLGDFNIAPQDQDVYDPEVFRGQILFSEPEKAALRRLLDWGLVDVFRRFNTEGRQFSWWDYRMNAFRRNLGARIDLILATAPLADRAASCMIDKEPRRREKSSDHTPVLATFNLD